LKRDDPPPETQALTFSFISPPQTYNNTNDDACSPLRNSGGFRLRIVDAARRHVRQQQQQPLRLLRTSNDEFGGAVCQGKRVLCCVAKVFVMHVRVVQNVL
jgi:hypothetical protein